MPGFYEFFCGGGMARAGLGRRMALPVRQRLRSAQGRAYAANWGARELRIADVASLGARRPAGPRRSRLGVVSLPGPVARRRGRGPRRRPRSGAFWGFCAADARSGAEGRAPRADRARERARRADLQGRRRFRRDLRGARTISAIASAR